jgi:hypothetical protein
VPSDAPELRTVLEEFEHKLEAEGVELRNAWGGIIVTQNQDDLKRVDLFIVWDEVEIVSGSVVLDASGNPIPVFQTQQVMQPKLDESGNPVLNETSGQPEEEPVLDENGNPVVEQVLDENGNPVPSRLISSEHVFIHEQSDYFD